MSIFRSIKQLYEWINQRVFYKRNLVLKSISKTNVDSIASDTQSLLANLDALRYVKVSEIMIPRADIIGVRYNDSLQQLQEKLIQTRFTRIPIYKSTLDQIIGFVHVKDILPYMGYSVYLVDKTFTINKVMCKLIYVPKFTKCIDVLIKMRHDKTHMAVILDEYGGAEGIISIEHIVGKIIGEIKSEHNDKLDEALIKKISNTEYLIDGRTPIQDIEKILGLATMLSQEEGEYETLGGFVLSYLDRIPIKGEGFLHPSGFYITIIDADPRKIKLLKLTLESK